MIGYTCAKCKREMICLKNEVPLVHFTNDNKNDGIDVVRYGDLYECKTCGCQVVAGLSLNQRLGIDLTDKQKKSILKNFYVEVKRVDG